MPRTTTTKPSGKSKSKSRAKPRTFVVDTSVLLSDPLALTRFAEHEVVLPVVVLTELEDYGFCKKGEGGDFVASGALRLDGALPTNTSGGQLSEAHAEGVLQIVEGIRQMRHTYPAHRQVKDAEIALISGHGGNQVCHSTLILGRA